MSHFEKFRRFADETFKSKSWASFVSDDLGGLSKSKMIKAIDIPRSAFYQDRLLVAELAKVETKLRKTGIVKQRQKVEPCEALAVDAIEQIALLDQLHQRLNVIEAANESLRGRIVAIDEQIKPYADGLRS